MSSYIPPILSSSPPPMDAVDDDDDDFGDFAAAHFSIKEDNLVSKLNLDDSSWSGPGLNSPPTQPSTPIKQNGTIPNNTKSETSGPADWGGNEDEETQQQTDNTSQNSVVSAGSGVTDSGLCSASQNSEGVSPLPQLDLNEEEIQSESVLSPVVVCNNPESVDTLSPVNVKVSSEDGLDKSEEIDGSVSEESNSGFVSRFSSSPPDLDLDVNVMCKPEENLEALNDDSTFAPSQDEGGGAEDDDFGDFSAFDPPPLHSGENSPQSDFAPEEIKEEVLKEELQPLEFEPIHPEEKENETVLEEGGDERMLPVDKSDLGDVNEFSSFEEADIPSCTKENDDNSKTPELEKTDPSATSEDEDDFADFESAQPAAAPVKEAGSLFADFSNISSCPEEAQSSDSQWANLPPERPLSDLSDADSFGDFESDTVQPSFFTCEDVRKRLPEVLSSMFPPVQELEESVQKDEHARTDEMLLNTEDSATWQSLRDLESTPALSFHWPGSHANRCLLAALNIDSRNVLFGPKWSTVVPRFASNLSFSPLEPVRAGQMQTQEEPHSKPPEPVNTTQPSNQEPPSTLELQDIVPAAQFDWSGSGLENPLECKWKAETSTNASTPPPPPPRSSSPAPAPLPPPLQPSVPQVAPPLKSSRDPTLSPEAVRVLDSLPELAFLSAKKLMFPVYGETAAQKH